MKRDDDGERATNRLCETQDSRESKYEPRWSPPKEGDLVLVRDKALDNQKGNKLLHRWSAPRILEHIKPNGNTAYVRKIHDPPPDKTKNDHFDDLKVFVKRSTRKDSAEIQPDSVSIESRDTRKRGGATRVYFMDGGG